MKIETVYSQVEDKKIKSNIEGSPIWKSAIHPDELKDTKLIKEKPLFEYTVKFDGLKPIQVTKIKKITNK
jgi:hypothetical protein